jgi:mutator protein MutT
MELSGVIITNDDGHLLLLHRATPKRTQWEIPGGKIEPGEDSESAAEREAKEELGVAVTVSEVLGGQDFDEDGHTISYTWMRGHLPPGVDAAIGEPEKYDDIRYWSINDLQQSRDLLSPNTKNFLDQMRAGRITL